MPTQNPAPAPASAKVPFELKSATLPVVALLLKSTDTYAIRKALAERFADEPDFFDNDAVIIDLSAVRDDPGAIDFRGLMGTLRSLKTTPVAVRGGNAVQIEFARAAGLSVAPDAPPQRAAPEPAQPSVEIREVVREVEVVREAPASETVLIDKPLRSGQQVYARGADLIVMTAVNFGAEVIADGHVHVYAPLRGRAIAGARGNPNARILTLCLEAQLVSVAGIYRTAENDLPPEVAGRPAQVRLDGERLLIEPLGKG
ncbi:MAG: septum site-determining protein MinC [Comamonadaceae bacterium]|nr:septum site-determining protein MinC [Comamonadaceae bacterium]